MAAFYAITVLGVPLLLVCARLYLGLSWWPAMALAFAVAAAAWYVVLRVVLRPRRR